MIAYIDRNRDRFGVEPICRLLPIAPSTYHDVNADDQGEDADEQGEDADDQGEYENADDDQGEDENADDDQGDGGDSQD